MRVQRVLPWVVVSWLAICAMASAQTLVFREGFDDAFGGPIPDPNEQATPSPGLLQWVPGDIEFAYDATVIDERFIETIDGLPPDIVSATVRFRMRPHSNNNDTVRLIFVDEFGERVGPQWVRSINDLTPGDWSVGGPYAGTGFEFSYPLDALPLSGGGTIDLTPAMRDAGYIDFYVTDDTGVDFVEISVTVPTEQLDGTCPTVIAGNDVCASREDLGVAPTAVYGASQRTNDEDWYLFNVPGNGSAVDITLEASDSMELEFYRDDCSGTLVATASGTDLSLSRFLTSTSMSPTAYLVRVRPSSSTVYSCSNLLEYLLRIDVPDVPCKLESGTCDIDANDGCDNSGLITDVNPIACGIARCGTIYEDGIGTDYDWYRFSNPSAAKLTTWVLQAEFDWDLEIRDIGAGTCPGMTVYSATGPAGGHSFEIWLDVGTYVARVTTTSTAGNMDCALQTAGGYRLELNDCVDAAADPAIPLVSITDGRFDDPATWDAGVAPSPVSRVSIRHDVRLADSGSPGEVELRELVVESGGILRPVPASDTGGAALEIRADRVEVQCGGSLLGGEGDTGSGIAGGAVTIRVPSEADGPVINQGLIQGGDGERGGSVTILAPTVAVVNEACADLSNRGRIRGGFPSGDIALLGDTVTNDGGRIACGPANGDHPAGGRFTIKAVDEVISRNLSPFTGEILSNSLSSAPGIRMRNYYQALNRAELGSSALIDCGSFDGRILCINADIIDIQGTIKAHVFCGDPPILTVSGDAFIEATEVVLAGEQVRVRNLNASPAIVGHDSVDLFATPGGQVDLRGLPAGQDWISSTGGITIHADLIRTDGGVVVDDIMDPPPVELPAAIFRELCVTPESAVIPVVAGATVEQIFDITNCGSGDVQLTVDLSDSGGWLEQPFSLSDRDLTSAQSLTIAARFFVPADAANGTSDFVTFDVTPATGQGDAQSITLELVVGSGENAAESCQGIDGENILSINGSTGAATDRVVAVGAADAIAFDIALPAAGGNGKFVAHLDEGTPTQGSISPLPAQLGPTCFEFLLTRGATPACVWTNINKPTQIGVSNYFGNAIADPERAPTTFLDLAPGGHAELPIGSSWTLQAAIINPNASSPKGASITNAVVLRILP